MDKFLEDGCTRGTCWQPEAPVGVARPHLSPNSSSEEEASTVVGRCASSMVVATRKQKGQIYFSSPKISINGWG